MNPTAAQLAEIRNAITRLTQRAPLIAQHAHDWQPGYPAGGGLTVTSSPIPDQMAERFATANSPRNVDHEGDLPENDDGTTQDPQPPPAVKERDPSLAAHLWCQDWLAVCAAIIAPVIDWPRLFKLTYDLERRSTWLMPVCAHERCGQPASVGNWCLEHKPGRVVEDPAADCEACGRQVQRTAADRLRRGLCEPCYKHWKRAERNGEGYDAWQRQRRNQRGCDLKAG